MRKNTVNRALTSKRRERAVVENDAYAAFTRRVVRAQGRRVGNGDVDGLAELLALADQVEAAIHAAVNGLRKVGYSWAEIATRLGISRQAAQQRWGGEARRLPDGEPCTYADRFGSDGWHEHDHAVCTSQMSGGDR